MPLEWIDHLRIRKSGEGRWDLFVISSREDSGLQHYGLTEDELGRKIQDYMPEMLAGHPRPMAPLRGVIG